MTMSESVNAIKPALPSYPVRPVKPATKDRESGERKEKPRQHDTEPDTGDESKPTIDEYV